MRASFMIELAGWSFDVRKCLIFVKIKYTRSKEDGLKLYVGKKTTSDFKAAVIKRTFAVINDFALKRTRDTSSLQGKIVKFA